jgi:kinesin family protein C1
VRKKMHNTICEPPDELPQLPDISGDTDTTAIVADSDDITLDLPDVVLERILAQLDAGELCTQAAPACRRWREVAARDAVWCVVFLRSYPAAFPRLPRSDPVDVPPQWAGRGWKDIYRDELKGNIRVFCRVRPMMDHDGDTGVAALRYPKSTVDGKEAIEVVVDEGVKRQFGFDKVFPERSSQLQVFNEVSSLVYSAIAGYRCCIFAYGQTGAGKTHTMQGTSGEDRGIIPRSLEMIVTEAQRLKLQGWEYTLHASFLEIHNENLRDLLCDPTAPKVDLSIKHLPNGQSLVTNAVEEEIAANAGDIARLMHRAQLQRSVGFTAMNAASSRSHAVFRLRLEGSKEGEDSVSGMLNLIDLAGSERLDKSEATGERLKETQAINKSLSALGNVFFALVNGQGHVPFRDSKLTHLLQPCLGGNCKTLMLSNISPAQSSSGESLCSLRFASRVNKCELGRAKKQVSNGDGGGGGGGGGGGATKRVQPRRKSKVDAAEAAAAAKADKAASKPGRRNTGMANVRPTTAKDSRPARNVRPRTGR